MTPEHIEQEVKIREYKPREIIVAEGSPNDRFFVILQGNVEILQNNKSIRVLKDGDVFGIENYYLNRAYTTSAISMTKSRVAAYDTIMIKDFIYDRPQLIQQILESAMRQLEQTTEVAEENISFESVININENIFHDGEIIIEEGYDDKDIYCLVETEGGLLVTKEGKEVGKITQPGEIFGEMSSILNEKRNTTIRSIGRSVIQVFSGENLQSILESYPQLSIRIINTLAKRLNEANDKKLSKNSADI